LLRGGRCRRKKYAAKIPAGSGKLEGENVLEDEKGEEESATDQREGRFGDLVRRG